MLLNIEKNNGRLSVRANSGPCAGKVIAHVESARIVGPLHACRLERPWGVTIINEQAMSNSATVRALGLMPGGLRSTSTGRL